MKARYITPDDEEGVLALARMQVEETLPHMASKFCEERVRSVFRHAQVSGDPTIFVVEDKGVLIGYLVAKVWPYLFTATVHVAQEVVYIRPDKRGSRAAASLFGLYSKWAAATKADEAFAGISNGLHPERTARFMKKFGFEVVGVSLRRIQGEADDFSKY